MIRRGTIILGFCAITGLAIAQYYGREIGYVSAAVRTARELPSHSTGTPEWTNPVGFERDVFTFARIRRGSIGRGANGWTTDAPDSDLNLSYRLQQVTSMKVNPDGRFVSLTDKDLGDYPFIYMVEPGDLYLTGAEIERLRAYLQNGGFLLLDDFWGDSAWDNVESIFRKVLPGNNFTELPLSHGLYKTVFQIGGKWQVPNVGTGTRSEFTGVTSERHDGDTQTVHHRAIFDEKGRLMVLALHNTDNGDGWEREGENHYYFENFSEKTAYPLAINILFYVMTH